MTDEQQMRMQIFQTFCGQGLTVFGDSHVFLGWCDQVLDWVKDGTVPTDDEQLTD